jgi:hypothetical protein
MLYKFIIFFFFINLTFGFKPNNTPLFNNGINKLSLNPSNMIDLLISIKEYTIITDNDSNKDLEELMARNNLNVYYINLNNLLDKNDILSYLKQNYNNLESAENLWIFYKGYIIGSRNEINNIILKKML